MKLKISDLRTPERMVAITGAQRETWIERHTGALLLGLLFLAALLQGLVGGG